MPLDEIDRLLMKVQDPEVMIRGQTVPVTTSLLYRVCDNDIAKFT